MGLPVGADVDEVDVVALAELAPSLAARVGGCSWQAFGDVDRGYKIKFRCIEKYYINDDILINIRIFIHWM